MQLENVYKIIRTQVSGKKIDSITNLVAMVYVSYANTVTTCNTVL